MPSLAGLVEKRFQGGGCIGFGGAAELGRLFGTPLPVLPSARGEAGEESLFVEVHHELKEAFRAHLSALLSTLDGRWSPKGRAGPPPETGRGGSYEDLLVEILGKVVLADRRQGLANLFWLSHSLEVAEVIDEIFGEEMIEGDGRYQLHPLLEGFYRHVERKVDAAFSRPEMKRIEFCRGREAGESLVRSIIGDQLPLTEPHPFSFDPLRVLVPRNRRFAISAAAFEEITEVLSARIAAAIEDGDGEILKALRRTAPAALPEAIAEQGRLRSYVFQEPVQSCLLRDFDGVVPVLSRSRILKRERDAAGSWGALLARYTDVTDCVLRCQVISVLRERLERSGRGREGTLDEGVYSFSRHADVVNEVRQVVILFGDLRDFTRTSEGAISERGLTEELYRIFDPAAIVVGTFGGRMDKYLGDGFMATFGGEGRERDASLAALRAAVAVQKILERLQALKKTAFRMGLSLHSGRAAIARFLLDDQRSERTPIGRQVNIAGRISSPGEGQEEGWRKSVREGIVVSGPFLDDLRKSVDLESFDEEERRGCFFHDEASQFRLCFDYAGEGRFKGLEGTLSLYRLTAEKGGGDG